MPSILDTLFYQHARTHKEDPAVLQRIATNTGMLKKNFNKWQRVRLLRIIDDKDQLAWQHAHTSFKTGARFGIQLMLEVFADNDDM